MADNLVVATDIKDLVVYGQQQVDYTVDGLPNQDFATAVAKAALRRAVTVEDATVALSHAIRKRQTKLADLGNALAVMNRVAADFEADDETTEWSGWSTDLYSVHQVLDRYGVKSLFSISGNQARIQKSDLSLQQVHVENSMDNEDNDLQQEMIALQGYVQKRDEGYNTAYTLVRRALRCQETTIGNIGK